MGNSVESYKVEALALEHDEQGDVIDLDAPEYQEYIKLKRKSLSEAALADLSYLEWRKTNSGNSRSLAQRTPLRTVETSHNNNHELVIRRTSAPVTGNERFLVAKRNSQACEQRSLQSKQRIQDIRQKYNLQDRDYNARSCIMWTEQQKDQWQKEREQSKALRKQIRLKYNLPFRQSQRSSAVASG